MSAALNYDTAFPLQQVKRNFLAVCCDMNPNEDRHSPNDKTPVPGGEALAQNDRITVKLGVPKVPQSI